mgnify:CR=1 FL=1
MTFFRGIKAGPKAAGYCTIKSALIQLTKSIAIDFGCDGIRANAICPGDTFVSRWLEEGYYTNEKTPVTLLEASSPIEVPLQRIGRPNDISHLVTFMISGKNTNITFHQYRESKLHNRLCNSS